MDTITAKLASKLFKNPIKGDDFVDRLHYFFTVTILVVFAIGTGLQEYVGKPINCWTPKEYHYENYHEHINSYCWTHELRYPQFHRSSVLHNTTGFFDLNQPKPLISFGTAFFRWVTLVFIVQACLFKLPNFVWTTMKSSSGADLEKIRDLVSQAQSAETDESKQLKMDEVVAYFENWVTGYRSYRLRIVGKHSAKVLSVLFCLGKKSGSYLSSLYLFVKILNLINVIGNVALLAVFLDLNFWKYGLVALNSVINEGDWNDPYNFPRLLICDFTVEGNLESGSSQPSDQPTVFQVQCTMTLNLLLEKVFVLEWFWLVFLFFITFVNIILWAVKIKPPCSTIFFQKSYLSTIKSAPSIEVGLASMITGDSLSQKPSNIQKSFIEEYLQSDGVFVLRLLEINSDKSLVADLVNHLWDRYRIIHKCNIASANGKDGMFELDETEAAVEDQSL